MTTLAADHRARPVRPSCLKMPTDDTELGYLAGLLDGEGSISVMRSHSLRKFRNTVRITISNTSPELMEWLLKIGGGVSSDGANRKNTQYRWQISARSDVIHFLEVITPLLKIKRRAGEEALRWALERRV